MILYIFSVSECVSRGGSLRADLSGPGWLLGLGQHPGGADTRQVQQAGRPQEGGMGRQGRVFLFIERTEIIEETFCCLNSTNK